jgi:hypothetical protein
MTDAPTNGSAAELWTRAWFPWASGLAPSDLTQPINPGWTFGNVVVNEHNSTAPQTEQAIVAEVSYGRQIGKLLDAVYALSKAQPDAKTNPAFKDIAALHAKVERIKVEAAKRRIDQFRRDLELLKTTDKTAYDEAVAALRADLGR